MSYQYYYSSSYRGHFNCHCLSLSRYMCLISDRWRDIGRKSLINGEEMKYTFGYLPQLFQLTVISHITKNKHCQDYTCTLQYKYYKSRGMAAKAIIEIWLNIICSYKRAPKRVTQVLILTGLYPNTPAYKNKIPVSQPSPYSFKQIIYLIWNFLKARVCRPLTCLSSYLGYTKDIPDQGYSERT